MIPAVILSWILFKHYEHGGKSRNFTFFLFHPKKNSADFLLLF